MDREQLKTNFNNLLQKKGLQYEKRVFVFKIICTLIGYIGITLWLNAIRATAPLWIVWTLIIVQFILYCSIFSVSYLRSKVCGLKRFGFIIFLIPLILGRINDWELLVIPLLIIIMLIVSAKTKNTSKVWTTEDFFGWRKETKLASNPDLNKE